MKTTISRHAHTRIKERLHIKSFSRARRFVEKAWLEGSDASLIKEVTFNHLTGFSFSSEDTIAKFYHDSIFIFSNGGELITVYRFAQTAKRTRDNFSFIGKDKLCFDVF